ncbi:MAG: transporter substrate-binding protein [Paenibacillus sp.]|jgi:multiple sugar transport system substrate-binding protein|nr:transporter substrate-binding protein [Paenibacillus sp.]
MKHTTKHSFKLLGLFLIAALVTLSGCTSSPADKATGQNKADSNPGARKITLDFWTGAVLDQGDFDKLIATYTAKVAPNVEIKLTHLPFNGLDEKMNVAIAANTFPDVYMDGVARLGPMSVRGIAAPLDSYITGDYNLSDVSEGTMKLSKVNGKLMVLPVTANIPQGVMLVNKTLFKQAGAEELLPDPTTRAWSRETFSKAVEKIGSLGNGIYGFGLAAGATDHDKMVDAYIYNDGDDYMDEKYNKMIYNSEKNVRNFEWLLKLASTKYAVPGVAGNKEPNLFELFKQGKIGVMNNNLGYYDIIQKGLKDGTIKGPMDVMFAHYPTTDGKAGKMWISSYGMIVKQQDNAEKMKEAAKFALWMTSGKIDEMNQMLIKKGHIPARNSVLSLIKEPEYKVLAKMPEKVIQNNFIIPNYQQVRKIWFNQFQQAFGNKDYTAKQALDNFVKEAQKTIDEGKQKQ